MKIKRERGKDTRWKRKRETKKRGGGRETLRRERETMICILGVGSGRCMQ